MSTPRQTQHDTTNSGRQLHPRAEPHSSSHRTTWKQLKTCCHSQTRWSKTVKTQSKMRSEGAAGKPCAAGCHNYNKKAATPAQPLTCSQGTQGAFRLHAQHPCMGECLPEGCNQLGQRQVIRAGHLARKERCRGMPFLRHAYLGRVLFRHACSQRKPRPHNCSRSTTPPQATPALQTKPGTRKSATRKRIRPQQMGHKHLYRFVTCMPKRTAAHTLSHPAHHERQLMSAPHCPIPNTTTHHACLPHRPDAPAMLPTWLRMPC